MPHTGKGLELFDSSSLGQSSFAEQVNYRRALQGELARSITALAQVESARVLIAFGKRSLAKDQEQPASASVALHLHAGQTRRPIRSAACASWPPASRAQARVRRDVDNHGNPLDAADPGAVDHRSRSSAPVTGRVRNMLERVVGTGKVSVVTNADVDDRGHETQEVMTPSTPRCAASRAPSRAPTHGTCGIAGTRGNLPGAPAAGPTGGSSGAGQRLQETKNYEVSRTVRQTTKPDVQLQKLHVAVVVDYKAGADGKPAARTDKELAELTALARQSAGIDDARGDKIEVRSIPFASDADAAAAAAVPPAISGLPLPLLDRHRRWPLADRRCPSCCRRRKPAPTRRRSRCPRRSAS
jgi:flagellar M-ring protein FliF